MSVPVHKLEVYVVEVNNVYGLEEAKLVINNAFRDALVLFGPTSTKTIQEWTDEHPLNYTSNDPALVFFLMP